MEFTHSQPSEGNRNQDHSEVTEEEPGFPQQSERREEVQSICKNAQTFMPIQNLQVNNYVTSGFQQDLFGDTFMLQNLDAPVTSAGSLLSKPAGVAIGARNKPKRSEIPFSTHTQKARRIEQQMKAVEVTKKKRKITKKQIKKLVDRNLQWKKQKDARIYDQKVKLELKEKQECTFNPKINEISKALCVSSNGRL